MSSDLYRRFAAELDREWLDSPLGQWLTEHEQEVADLIDGAETVDWTDLADSFAQAGLLDARGRLPNAETARETWRRVRERPRFW